MQREIEFRGQKEDTKEWIYGNLIINDRDDEVYIGLYESKQKGIGLEWNVYKVIPETVGQYTSLNKDKNGKKIYEGDILGGIQKMSNIVYPENKIHHWNSSVKHLVKFDPANLFFTESYAKFCTVIGNIHENPELLQEVE